MNTVTIIGRLTTDAELRFYESGSAKAEFGIAVERNYQKSGGEKKVSFFNIEVWGKPAENLCQYRHKGDEVAVTGELIQDRWERDGNKRSRVYINANRIDYLRKKGEGKDSNQSRPPAPQSQSVPAYTNDQAYGRPMDDYEDVPF